MSRRHSKPILAAIVAALLTTTPVLADCRADAEQWAASVWHMDPRLKVPVYAAIGWLVGRPALFAVIAANAESPRERWMIRNYTVWCESGYDGDPPRVPPAFIEFF